MQRIGLRGADKTIGAGVAYLHEAAQLSATDRAIVDLLQFDGRLPYSHIARQLGIAQPTVRRRVNDLRESGVIEFVANTNPYALGYNAAAMVGVDIDGSAPATSVARELAAIPAVDYVVVVYGQHAIYVELFAADMQTLVSIVEESILAFPGVGAVRIYPYLSVYYQQAQFSVARLKAVGDAGVRPRPLDETDREIIAALSADGRAPFLEIARHLGVSEAQVRTRVKRMTSEGALHVMAIINPMSLDYRTMAWLAVNVKVGFAVSDVAEELANLPFVTYVAIATGGTDIFAEVICLSEAELLTLFESRVRLLEGIRSVNIEIYLALHYGTLRPLMMQSRDATARTNSVRRRRAR